MRTIAAAGMDPFVASIFRAAGSDEVEAATIASHLVEASLMGHDSHGLIRISKYIDWLRAGEVVANQHAQVVTDRGALLVIDGGFGYGQVIGREAMELAAKRAHAHGVAAIAIRNSGHLGRIGAWPDMLARRGFASIHFVNTSGYGILVAPHGGSDRRFSANPIAAGVPMEGGDPYILDIATSSIAEGKIQVARNKGDKLPAGLLLDGQGRPTDDPEAFYADPPGAILPFGAHKGSGLSFFCEILAGSLSGGFASNPQSPTAKRLVNNMLSMVFDPAAFGSAEAFAEDVSRLVDWSKATPPVRPGEAVLLPGEIERQTYAARLARGLPVDDETWRKIVATATSLGVAVPEL
jgi:uncharacterized oxidoreductase